MDVLSNQKLEIDMKYMICNLPIWKGKVKARKAKALARPCSIIHFSNIPGYRSLKVGDIINDCSGFNKRIAEIRPEYYPVQGGKVLCDITFVTHDSGHCSLTSCGVEVNVSRETIEKQVLSIYDECVVADVNNGNSFWYGPKDNWTERDKTDMEVYKHRAETIRSGGHICDEAGFLLKEFKRS